MVGVGLNEKVREILLMELDPIGVGDVPQAADEYDVYAAPIARMISEGRSEAELACYLIEIEAETLNLEVNSGRALRVAAMLHGLA